MIKIKKDTTKIFNKKFPVSKNPSYIQLSNAYAQLPDFSADLLVSIRTTCPHDDNVTNVTHNSTSDVTNVTRHPNKPKLGANKMHSRFKQKLIARFLNREIKRQFG